MAYKDSKKGIIAKSFSVHADTYDRYARLQQMSAKFIVDNVLQNYDQVKVGPVLEIGCGSGMLSEFIVGKFPDRDIAMLDIAPGMLEICRQRIAGLGLNNDRLTYVAMDAENINEENKYALIVSGLTLQWFNDLQKGLNRILAALVPGGIFICSFLGAGSFKEWDLQCRKINLGATFNQFPDFGFLSKELESSVKKIDTSINDVVISYKNALEFFVSLKKTGTAVNFSGHKLTVSQMKNLIKGWDENCPAGIDMTFKIYSLTITK